jgi:uncharacterized protein YutE (UPF0331/DUF86 family)
MPEFDRDTVLSLLSQLRKSLDRLDHLSRLPEPDFMKDADKIGSAKYHFIVAIESCIDLSNHVISRNRLRVPEDYGDTFRVLAESNILPTPFADELVAMAKFRNRLVHLYWEVSDRQVHELLKSRLPDFSRFLKFLSDYLEWENLQA